MSVPNQTDAEFWRVATAPLLAFLQESGPVSWPQLNAWGRAQDPKRGPDMMANMVAWLESQKLAHVLVSNDGVRWFSGAAPTDQPKKRRKHPTRTPEQMARLRARQRIKEPTKDDIQRIDQLLAKGRLV